MDHTSNLSLALNPRQGLEESEVARLVGPLRPEDRESFPAADRALRRLSEAYEGHALEPFWIDGGAFDRHFDQAYAQLGNASLYGEILPASVVRMFTDVGARPGMTYYDLGSGFGKTVLLAGLLGLRATGVELVDQRWRAACDALSRAQEVSSSALLPGQVRMVHGNILKYDFSDADIVFTDSLAFSDDVIEQLARAAGRMRNGTRIITARPLDGAWLKDLETFTAPSSWASDFDWLVQEVRGLPAQNHPGLAEVQEEGPATCSS